MIDFLRIKMPEMIFNPESKGWFKALGLHHALITMGGILLFSVFGVGGFGAAFSVGWYASREYGNGPYPPRTFEVMDFISPLIVSIAYFIINT